MTEILTIADNGPDAQAAMAAKLRADQGLVDDNAWAGHTGTGTVPGYGIPNPDRGAEGVAPVGERGPRS